MKLAYLLLSLVVAVTPGAPAAAAPTIIHTTPTPVALYRFEAAQTTAAGVADLSGQNNTLTPRAADGGAVQYATRADGRAAMMPRRCVTGVASCPRVTFEAPHKASLSPGLQRLKYGATIAGAIGAVGVGANILQKGVNPGSQYKLQIGASGKPNCVISGAAAGQKYLARSSIAVTDGQWHQISCERAGTSLTIRVDDQVRGWTTVPAQVTIANTAPLRIGSRSLADRTDRFGGGVDDIFVIIGG
ncbi:LamG domain-containing protein [Pilimelia columellifera]|uniref:Concanavalin A-like lectin/glucanase superfamily protein n=1 Tax=Pilimelia columellifera subsp. columellifera TaxID=706583 RepID=A0ABP6AXU7_9ACTN